MACRGGDKFELIKHFAIARGKARYLLLGEHVARYTCAMRWRRYCVCLLSCLPLQFGVAHHMLKIS